MRAQHQHEKRPKSPTLTLEITEELIEDAVPRDSSHCLWAEAVKVKTPPIGPGRRRSFGLRGLEY